MSGENAFGGLKRKEIYMKNKTDHIIFRIELPMAERIKLAMDTWEKNDRHQNYLLTGEAFFAAQCWVFTHGIYDHKSDSHDPELMEFINCSRQGIGGHNGWNAMLSERVGCSECGETWKKENIKYCVKCMRFVCFRCDGNHTGICNEILVG
jgi:hypothetical protein